MVSNYPQKQKLPHQRLPTYPALEGGVSIILWKDRSTATYFVRHFFFLTHKTSKKATLPTQNLVLFSSFPIQSIAYLATWWTCHTVSHIKGESHNVDALAQQSVGSIHLTGYTLKMEDQFLNTQFSILVLICAANFWATSSTVPTQKEQCSAMSSLPSQVATWQTSYPLVWNMF